VMHLYKTNFFGPFTSTVEAMMFAVMSGLDSSFSATKKSTNAVQILPFCGHIGVGLAGKNQYLSLHKIKMASSHLLSKMEVFLPNLAMSIYIIK